MKIQITSKDLETEYLFDFVPNNNDGYGVLKSCIWTDDDDDTCLTYQLESGFYRTDDVVLALQIALGNQGEYRNYTELTEYVKNQEALHA